MDKKSQSKNLPESVKKSNKYNSEISQEFVPDESADGTNRGNNDDSNANNDNNANNAKYKPNYNK
jgi:hypothetical protein